MLGFAALGELPLSTLPAGPAEPEPPSSTGGAILNRRARFSRADYLALISEELDIGANDDEDAIALVAVMVAVMETT